MALPGTNLAWDSNRSLWSLGNTPFSCLLRRMSVRIQNDCKVASNVLKPAWVRGCVGAWVRGREANEGIV